MLELLVEFRNGTRKSFLFSKYGKACEVKEKLIKLGYRIIYMRNMG